MADWVLRILKPNLVGGGGVVVVVVVVVGGAVAAIAANLSASWAALTLALSSA